MSSIISGDVVLRHPRRRAVYSESSETYRFFYKYRAMIPIEDLLRTQRDADIDPGIKFLVADVWIPVTSPTISFQDKSLVYMRGRLEFPAKYNVSRTIVGRVHIEVIFAHFRRVVEPEVQFLLYECLRPEPTIFGRIVDISETSCGWICVMVEIREKVDAGSMFMFIG